MIAKVDGQVRVLSAAEQASVCASTACEPNYIYHAAVVAKPAAKAPVKAATAPAVTLDYSKKILGLADAWKITRGSRSVKVGLVDTGSTPSHPNLKDNITTGAAPAGESAPDGPIFGWNFVNDSAGAIDDNGHGTHCSGTIGVSPVVSILPVKFLDDQGSGSSADGINAINYAVANGVQILSLSWGGPGESDLLNEAIQNAINAGVLVVAAAGNDSTSNDTTPSYPASYPGVISVASSDENDALSDFSNYGSSVTIAAPGSDIYSTLPDDQFGILSGTSMATPQVAGALALAYAAKPGLAAADLNTALCSTAKKILTDSTSCGRLDVAALVSAVTKL
jgi:subtilisin family serine protease